MSWIFFAVAAQTFFAISNFADRFLIEKRVRNEKNLSVIGGVLVLAGFVILTIKGFPLIGWIPTIALLAGGTSAGIALIPHYKALSLDDTSRVVPFYQMAPLIVLVLSWVFLGEKLNSYQLIGFFITIVGGYLLAVQKIEKSLFEVRRSFWWIMLASFLFSIPVVLYKYVVVSQNYWTATGYDLLGTGVGAFLIYLWLDKKDFWNEVHALKASTWTIIVSDEVSYLLGVFCLFFASTLTAVSLVVVVGSIQPFIVLVIGLVLSVWFPHIIEEDISRSTLTTKTVAILIIFVGLWLLSI